jgi:hypothetical protein
MTELVLMQKEGVHRMKVTVEETHQLLIDWFAVAAPTKCKRPTYIH